MKKSLILYSFLWIVFVGLISKPAFSAVQTTYTKTGNVITVKVTPDADADGLLYNYACTFRYKNSYGISLSLGSSNVAPNPIITVVTDPNDPAYNLARFEQYVGTTTVHWLANTEYELFNFTVLGGLGTSPISLAVETNYSYALVYYQLTTSTDGDITDYVTPFYAGTDNLVISTLGVLTLATENFYLGKYWLTSGTSDWATGSNWSDGLVPTAGQDVAILGGGTQPTAGAGSVCNKLVVETGAYVEIADAGTLTVDGNLSIADDHALWVKSLPTGTGSLIVNGTVPSGNKVLLERYFAPTTWSNNDDGWHLLSSPVAAQVIPTAFTTPDLSPERFDFYSWDEPSSIWLNIKDGSNPEGTFSTFGVGKGYIASYEGNVNGTTKQFIGTLNNSNVPVSLTNNGGGSAGSTGYNLLGNPFSSSITYNTTGWGLNNVGTKATQIWSNATKGYVTIADGAIIPANNGFMVYAGTGGGSLTIPLAARTHSATPFYKSSEPQITLVAHDPEGASLKSSMIRVNPEATAGFDLAYDCYMLGGYAPSFYSVADNSAFTINTIAAANNGLVVPFGFVKNGSTNFTIELAENIDGTLLVLRDKKTNTMVNMSQGSTYAFTSAEGDDANRFELLFGTQVGIEETGALAAANVYNVNGHMVVSNVKGDTQMNIFNVQGQLLKNFEFNSNGNQEISVNLPTGIYMVRLINGGAMKTMKVFVN